MFGASQYRTSRKLLALLVPVALALGAIGGATSVAATSHKQALIHGATVSGSPSLEEQAAVAAGFAVTVVSDATWSTMTAAQFGAYELLIVGDPTCRSTLPTGLVASAPVWGPVVLGTAGGRTQAGNRIVIGTDPVFHRSQGGDVLTEEGIAFAGLQPDRTGMYLTLSCAGSQVAQVLTLVNAVSSPTASGAWTLNSIPPCGAAAALIATVPGSFPTLTSADLQGWFCSVHESFPTFKGDFSALAIATDTPTQPTCGVDRDTGATVCGEAYILVAGSGIIIESGSISVAPLTDTNPVGTNHTVTATVTDSSGAPLANQLVTFEVTGVNAGAVGTCSPATCTSDASGNVSFTYNGAAGPGDDTIKASFTDAAGSLQSATAQKEWTEVSPPVADTLTPAVVDETLQAGESTEVDKTLHLGGLPAAADIIVAIDTTASMSGALIDAKADANQICLDVQAEIPGARFAAVEFQDYPVSPYGGAGDSPYELHTLGFTDNCATFSAGVAAMTLGFGGDDPESNNRVHFEAYSEPAYTAPVAAGGRDSEATQFLLVLADQDPHSMVALGACPSTDPLSDPGRNGINESGANDDIDTPDAIAGLNAADIVLLYISYNSGASARQCHEDLAAATGGDAEPSSEADDIGAFIIAQAEETPYTVDLEISAGCQIGFEFDPDFPQGPFTGEQTIEFVETITAPTLVGTYTCTITAVMTPGGPTTAVEEVTVTVVPGDPFRLELEPETDTNTVDDEHCVTATVTDEFGNPTPDVTVEFSVTGPGATEGSAETDEDGVAEFCYTSALPGEDDISAFADTNDSGAQDPGEPSDTATKTWVIPASTEGCRVTYGGWIIATNGDQATFGGNAQADGLRGQQEYQDHGPAVVMNVHSIDVLAVECSSDGTEASIFGTATVDGSGTFDYRIDLKDLTDTGASDTYRIRLSDGYDSGEQPLSGGNVRIH